MAVVRGGFAVLCVGILIYGTLDFLTNFEDNGCEMTYMFEMPEYVNVPLGREISENYPRYGLYVYGEGGYTKYVSNMKMEGIPVLFIPGNAGSYKQARSLGSVALRRVGHTKSPFHFNYFTVDLNEELMGLYGGTLQEQTEFVHLCIKKILTLYKQAFKPPSSVVLVGHSMGGIIARALFTLPDFDPSLVSTIITQATPHQGPVLQMDRKLSMFIRNVNQYWMEHSNSSVKHVTVVSTGGGYRDILVRNGLASLKGIVDDSRSVYTSTMSVPNAWVSTDHLCAVWCRQMVLATTRALFDIIDPTTLQVTSDAKLRMIAFQHHFLSHSGARQYIDGFNKEITIDSAVKWVIKEENLWEYARPKVTKTRYFAIPLHKKGTDSLVAISDVTTKDWICACKLKKGEKQCSKCSNLSQKGQLIPPKDSSRKVVHLKLSEVKDMTHIILIVEQTNQKVEVMADLYNQGERHLAYHMPGFIDILMTYPESVTKSASSLTLYNDTLFYSLRLQGIDTVLKAYKVTLQPRQCATSKTPDLHSGSMMIFHVPWSREDTYSFNRINQVGALSLKLQGGVSLSEEDGDLELKVYTDPSCIYVLNFVAAPSEMLGQLMRFYGPLLPGYMVAVLLMGLIQQLYIITRDGTCPSILDAIAANAQPFKLIPVVILIQVIVQHPMVQTIGIPELDGSVLTSQGLSFRFLPLMLYMISLGVVTFQSFIITNFFRIVGTVAGLLFSRCLGNMEDLWYKIQVFLCCIALGTSLFICSSLGIAVIYFIFLIKTLIAKYQSRSSPAELSKFHFFSSMFLLWLWMFVTSIPSFVSWVKNLKYSVMLYGDPNWISASLGITAAAIIILNSPLPPRIDYRVWYFCIYGSAVVMLLYGTVSIYRVPYFIVFTLTAISICQVLYKIQPPKQTTPNNVNQ